MKSVQEMTSAYSAEPLGRRPIRVLGRMFGNVPASRYLAYRLFLKDLKGERAKSMLAPLWDFLDPLVLAFVFMGLTRLRVVDAGELQVPYAVFVTFGLLLYQTFIEAITLPLDVIKKSRGLITHLRVSPEALVLSTLLRIAFNSGFRILVMLGVAIAMGSFSGLGFVKFLLLFPTIILAGMAIGLLLAPFNTLYNDVGRVVRIVLVPLRYVTPVLYAVPAVPALQFFDSWNPLSTILTSLRSLATQNVIADPAGYGLSVAGLSLTFFCGWFLFHVSMPILSERA